MFHTTLCKLQVSKAIRKKAPYKTNRQPFQIHNIRNRHFYKNLTKNFDKTFLIQQYEHHKFRFRHSVNKLF